MAMIIPTKDRPTALDRMLESYGKQIKCAEVVIVDASVDSETERVAKVHSGKCNVRYLRTLRAGAAAQRTEGILVTSRPFILFCDDDVLFELECLKQLWQAITSDDQLGGVSATIINQRYTSPGVISRTMFALLNGRNEKSFAGRVLGPAVNLLPEDRDDLPEVVPVEWLNLGCTIYRREALPDPVFDPHFTGYSLMEDLALSLRVAQRGWQLANARTAHIYHDSQPGSHKDDRIKRSEMELMNRHYVMTEILGRRKAIDYLRLVLWEGFQMASIRLESQVLRGKWRAFRKILRNG